MKRTNIVILSLLLIVQMVISPLQLAVAAQTEDEQLLVPATFEQTEAEVPASVPSLDNEQIDEQLEIEQTAPEIEETTLPPTSIEVDSPPLAEIVAPQVQEQEAVPADDPTEAATEATMEVLQSDNLEVTATNEKQEAQEQSAPKSLAVTLADLQTTVNGVKIDQLTETLAQNATVNMNFVFNTELFAPNNGDYFSFTLPETLVDWDNNFNGTQIAIGDSPGFKWETVNNVVTVTLTDVDQVKHAGKVQFEINFTSGFVFDEGTNSLEQQLVLPTSSGGEEIYKLTFLPKTSNEKMLQKSAVHATAIIENGQRYFEWTVWINKAGKSLTNAKLVDTPSKGHQIDGNIILENYSVGLLGISETASGTATYSTMDAITLNGTDAYKMTYRTVITLPAEEQDGKKEFSNTIALTNEGQETEQFTSPKVSTTYGTSLNKRLKNNGSNYRTSWEIDFNYNQLALSKEQATLTDTITGPQKIDLSTLKVYEVNVGTNGLWASDANGGQPVTNYTLSPASGLSNTFTLQFNDGIQKAYRVVYDAIYEEDFYTASGQRVTNGVSSGTKTLTPLYTTRNQDILRKNVAVNYDKQEITWTVTIKADNKEITDLTLTDTFTAANGKNGIHKLIGDVQDIQIKNGTKSTTTLLNDDPTKGFVMTGIHVAKGKTATITYKTSYKVEDTGKVQAQGYGNTADIDWTSSDIPYTLSVSNHYTPEKTTVNNGRKWGSFDYTTQQLSWQVMVNANKRDIAGAVLTDTLGAGHEIEAGTFEVYNYVRTGEKTGTEGALLDPQHYTVAINDNKTGYVLTFDSQLTNDLNNQAYIVKYKTKDSNNILGVESENTGTVGDSYTNSASFKTKHETVFNLISDPVKINPDVANSILKKSVQGNDSANKDGILTWIIDVNKSHSSLSNVVLSDQPSERILLDRNSIKVRPYTVTTNDISEGTEWKNPADFGFTVDITENGGFTLHFGTLERKGFQVQYKTYTLASSTEEGALENAAKLSFDEKDELAKNQQSESIYKNKFAFSKSQAGFSLTKGIMHFEKIGMNTTTGDVTPLQGAKFALYLQGTDILVRDNIISGEDGLFTIDNLNYGHYTLKEIEAPAGYTAADFNFTLNSTTDDAQQPLALINKKAEVTVEKIWDGGDATKRPDITIKLYQNGTEFDEIILANGETSYTWSNLPVSKDEKEFIYTVDEINTPTNYEKNVEGFTITNTYVAPITTITATKHWVNGPANKPTIELQLYRSVAGSELLEKVGPAIPFISGTTTYSWTDMPVSDHAGNAYTYSVNEVTVPEHYEQAISEDGLTITNTYVIPKTTFTATKKWVNGPKDKPAVQFQLLRDNEPYLEAVTLENDTYTWVELDKTDQNGHVYTYSVKEIDPPANYSSAVSEDGATITNTYVIPKTEVTGTKIWVNGPAQKPTIQLQLLRDGQAFGDAITLQNGETTYTWKNLDLTDELGHVYHYTVDELAVPTNYNKVIVGNIITNTYVSPLTDITVTKKWVNAPVVTPTIDIQLYRDGEPFGTTISLAYGLTSYTWKNVPTTDSDGKAYLYTVDEVNVPVNYVKSVEGMTITNEYMAPIVTPEVDIDPEVKSTPEVTPAPEVESTPEVTPAPEVESTPEVTPAPEVESTPEVTPAPGVESTPEVTPAPEVESTPEVTPAPEVESVLEEEQTTPAPLNKAEQTQAKPDFESQKQQAQLPQTNGETNRGMMLFGALFIAFSAYMLIRRQQKA